MDWQGMSIGMIRHDELLNALLAIWKTQHSLTRRSQPGQLAEEYLAGFEEALESVAQAAGISEAFEAARISHRAKSQARANGTVEIIDSRARLVDRY